ncbi:hypothetical protein KP509_17G046900 [Ceratopteris richardii]|uniref:Cytochrome c oxidase subunit 2 n=1 Tax=Ceratopteris richardii TaxID=49495 RepID=A0A8T2SXX4_CERRI|nr:hypothetical protein KP509_17G046800 [Ceratopteris richardii]KAH7373257.1 hypothetical protein KP509_17G046900 [Ceratopteris richardii]
MVHGTTIEIIWTILPSFVSMFIAIPSFVLLYSMDQVSLTFDSYMISEDDLELVVPAKTSFCMIITPADVLYSWAVPFPGAKRDARSEIRGTNYAFMPTVVEVVSLNEYLEWVSDHQQ